MLIARLLFIDYRYKGPPLPQDKDDAGYNAIKGEMERVESERAELGKLVEKIKGK
jgi:hypothetical protein